MKTTVYYNTSLAKRIAMIVICIAVGLASYNIASRINDAHAETVTTTGYVMCKSYVMIRMWPSRKAQEIWQLDPCDTVEVDGQTKDGFAHIVEPVDGWVWAGNLVFSEPEKVGKTAYVTANKRVACRRWVDGPQVESRPWLINGSGVQVFYMSADWACTSRGYIKAEYLEVDPQ
jgi:hypothetical protein